MSIVEYEVRENVASIYLNRPERLNAVVPRLVDELCEALNRAYVDRVGAVRLAGRGRAFCAGHDLREDATADDELTAARNMDRIQDVTRLIRKLECAVVSAVHGYALGAGCEFALGSDLIVAAESAQFGFPEVGVGLGVTGGLTHTLPLVLGAARAKELLLLGEQFSAREAHRMGLINRVVADDQLDAASSDLARQLSLKPRLAVGFAKKSIDRSANPASEAVLEREQLLAQIAMGSSEAGEGSRTFQERSASQTTATSGKN